MLQCKQTDRQTDRQTCPGRVSFPFMYCSMRKEACPLLSPLMSLLVLFMLVQCPANQLCVCVGGGGGGGGGGEVYVCKGRGVICVCEGVYLMI